jgi:hypothetical protein
MGIVAGHRNTVTLKPGHRNGLNVVTPRHGIPFAGSAEILMPSVYLKAAPTTIRFNAFGSLSGGSHLIGSSTIKFTSSGKLTNATIPLEASQRLKSEVWIKFNASGKLSQHHEFRGKAFISFEAWGKLTLAIYTIKNGLLYNYHAIEDSRGFAPEGWHTATFEDWTKIIQESDPTFTWETGGANTAGFDLRDTSEDYWNNTYGNTNSLGLNVRGSGERVLFDGSFGYIKQFSVQGTADRILIGGNYQQGIIIPDSDYEGYVFPLESPSWSETDKNVGMSYRWVKDNTTDPGTMTGNDGKTYPTTKIGDIVITAQNIAETKYRNGDTIPEITDNTEWIEATEGALCAYNNDWNNV